MHESEKWKWSRSVSVRLFVTRYSVNCRVLPPLICPMTAPIQSNNYISALVAHCSMCLFPQLNYSLASSAVFRCCYCCLVAKSCPALLRPHGLYSPWNSPDQNAGIGSLSFLQGIFPTQGWNPGPSQCRPILYQLSHKGSPRILEWLAYSFSSRFFQPRNQTGVSCIAGGFFTNWSIREFYIRDTFIYRKNASQVAQW